MIPMKPKVMMKTKKIPDPSQSARFIEAARELGCGESPNAFEAAVKKVARQRPKITVESKDTKTTDGNRN